MTFDIAQIFCLIIAANSVQVQYGTAQPRKGTVSSANAESMCSNSGPG